jgi:hypothetical protein
MNEVLLVKIEGTGGAECRKRPSCEPGGSREGLGCHVGCVSWFPRILPVSGRQAFPPPYSRSLPVPLIH